MNLVQKDDIFNSFIISPSLRNLLAIMLEVKKNNAVKNKPMITENKTLTPITPPTRILSFFSSDINYSSKLKL